MKKYFTSSEPNNSKKSPKSPDNVKQEELPKNIKENLQDKVRKSVDSIKDGSKKIVNGLNEMKKKILTGVTGGGFLTGKGNKPQNDQNNSDPNSVKKESAYHKIGNLLKTCKNEFNLVLTKGIDKNFIGKIVSFEKEASSLRNDIVKAKNQVSQKPQDETKEQEEKRIKLLKKIYSVEKIVNQSIVEIKEGIDFVKEINNVIGDQSFVDLTKENRNKLTEISGEIDKRCENNIKNTAHSKKDQTLYSTLISFILGTIQAQNIAKNIQSIQLLDENNEQELIKTLAEDGVGTQLNEIYNEKINEIKSSEKFKNIDDIKNVTYKEKINKIFKEKVEKEVNALLYKVNEKKAENFENEIKKREEQIINDENDFINGLGKFSISDKEGLSQYYISIGNFLTKNQEDQKEKNKLIDELQLKNIKPSENITRKGNKTIIELTTKLETEYKLIGKILKDINDAEKIETRKIEKEQGVLITIQLGYIFNQFMKPLLENYEKIITAIKTSKILSESQRNGLKIKYEERRKLIETVGENLLSKFFDWVQPKESTKDNVATKLMQSFSELVVPEIEKLIGGQSNSGDGIKLGIEKVITQYLQDKYRTMFNEAIEVKDAGVVVGNVRSFEQEIKKLFEDKLIGEKCGEELNKFKDQAITSVVNSFEKQYTEDCKNILNNNLGYEEKLKYIRKAIDNFDNNLGVLCGAKIITSEKKNEIFNNFKEKIISDLVKITDGKYINEGELKNLKNSGYSEINKKISSINIFKLIDDLKQINQIIADGKNENLINEIKTLEQYVDLIKRINVINEDIKNNVNVTLAKFEIKKESTEGLKGIVNEIENLKKINPPVYANLLNSLDDVVSRLNKRINTYTTVEKNLKAIKLAFFDNNKNTDVGNIKNTNDLFSRTDIISKTVIASDPLENLNLTCFSQEEINDINEKIKQETNNAFNEKFMVLFKDACGEEGEKLTNSETYSFVEEKYENYLKNINDQDGIKKIKNALYLDIKQFEDALKNHETIIKNNKITKEQKDQYISGVMGRVISLVINKIEKKYNDEFSNENQTDDLKKLDINSLADRAKQLREKLTIVNSEFLNGKDDLLNEKINFLKLSEEVNEINKKINTTVVDQNNPITSDDKIKCCKRLLEIIEELKKLGDTYKEFTPKDSVYVKHFTTLKNFAEDLNKNEKIKVYAHVTKYLERIKEFNGKLNNLEKNKNEPDTASIIKYIDDLISSGAEQIYLEAKNSFNEQDLKVLKNYIEEEKNKILGNVYDKLFEKNMQFYDGDIFNKKVESAKNAKKELERVKQDSKNKLGSNIDNLKEISEKFKTEQESLNKLHLELRQYEVKDVKTDKNNIVSGSAFKNAFNYGVGFLKNPKKKFNELKNEIEKNNKIKEIKEKIKQSDENLKKLKLHYDNDKNNLFTLDKNIDEQIKNLVNSPELVDENKKLLNYEGQIELINKCRENLKELKAKNVSDVGNLRIDKKLTECDQKHEEILLLNVTPDKLRQVKSIKNPSERLIALDKMLREINGYLDGTTSKNEVAKVKFVQRKKEVVHEIEKTKTERMLELNEQSKKRNIEQASDSMVLAWNEIEKVNQLVSGKTKGFNLSDQKDIENIEDVELRIYGRAQKYQLAIEDNKEAQTVNIVFMQVELQRVLKKELAWYKLVLDFTFDAALNITLSPIFLVAPRIYDLYMKAYNKYYGIEVKEAPKPKNSDEVKEGEKIQDHKDKHEDKGDGNGIKKKTSFSEWMFNAYNYLVKHLPFFQYYTEKQPEKVILRNLNTILKEKMEKVEKLDEDHKKLIEQQKKLQEKNENKLDKKNSVDQLNEKKDVNKQEDKKEENKLEKPNESNKQNFNDVKVKKNETEVKTVSQQEKKEPNEQIGNKNEINKEKEKEKKEDDKKDQEKKQQELKREEKKEGKENKIESDSSKLLNPSDLNDPKLKIGNPKENIVNGSKEDSKQGYQLTDANTNEQNKIPGENHHVGL